MWPLESSPQYSPDPQVAPPQLPPMSIGLTCASSPTIGQTPPAASELGQKDSWGPQPAATPSTAESAKTDKSDFMAQ